ncbi:MAG: TetR/AcrR family transcriptional regulator [Spirochaetes bacterium]|nr:MAG: TetR/AcrR family transcriptional regulator [Spirochaetota bacterium]
MNKTDTEMKIRVSFYGKIGEFFQPDGNFDRARFLVRLGRSLEDVKKKHKTEKTYKRAGAEWLSRYLNEVLVYLFEKGMAGAALDLFRSAISEAKNRMLDPIAVAPAFLENIIALGESRDEKTKRTNPSWDNKRKAIFKAALNVFERDGYPKSTMDAIAAGTGIGKASIYRMYKNKEALLDDMLQEKFNEIAAEINKIHSQESDVLGQIQEMVSYWLSFITDNYTVYTLIHNEKNSAGVSNRMLFYDHITANLPMFKERIVALNKENKLKTINFYTVFYGILGYIDGIVVKWLKDERAYDLTGKSLEILDVIFTGILTGDNGAGKHRR